MGIRPWRLPESGWGIVGLALTYVPLGIASGMSTLGGPWPGDTGLAIIAYAGCSMFIVYPVGLICAVIGLCHRHRMHFASILSMVVAVATFLGMTGRSHGPAVEVIILTGLVYLAVVLLCGVARFLLRPERSGVGFNDHSQGIENDHSDRDD